MFYVGIVGYGKMGKIYEEEIKKTKGFKLLEILDYKKLQRSPNKKKFFFSSKKINLIIISSPINTHYKYLKKVYKLNENFIIEKPLIENLTQLEIINKINKNFKKKNIIHHNDVLNIKKLQFFNKNNIRNVKKIEMLYGCNLTASSYKKPILDWLPHPLSVITNFFGEPFDFEILEYKNKKCRKIYKYQKLRIFFNFKNFPVFVTFSNNLKKPTKKIILYKKDRKIIYDGYKIENRRTVKLLLEKLYNFKKINDVKLNYKMYKLLFQIEKKINSYKK